jgi:trans-aconitate 2-methyltransferase
MKQSSEVKEFYDNYQFEFRQNIRHYSIINKLVDLGMKSDSRVLEIGCGNGALTKLIADKTKRGHIFALDISSESIAHAKRNLAGYQNITHLVTDVRVFESKDKFDVIVLSDVLEHIPLDIHDALFNNLNKLMDRNGFLFIHIPEPKYLEWITENHPDRLQVIDQPLHSHDLLAALYKNGFYLKQLVSYSLFHAQHDAQYLVLSKRELKENYEPTSKWSIIRRKYQYRFRNMLK